MYVLLVNIKSISGFEIFPADAAFVNETIKMRFHMISKFILSFCKFSTNFALPHHEIGGVPANKVRNEHEM